MHPIPSLLSSISLGHQTNQRHARHDQHELSPTYLCDIGYCGVRALAGECVRVRHGPYAGLGIAIISLCRNKPYSEAWSICSLHFIKIALRWTLIARHELQQSQRLYLGRSGQNFEFPKYSSHSNPSPWAHLLLSLYVTWMVFSVTSVTPLPTLLHMRAGLALSRISSEQDLTEGPILLAHAEALLELYHEYRSTSDPWSSFGVEDVRLLSTASLQYAKDPRPASLTGINLSLPQHLLYDLIVVFSRSYANICWHQRKRILLPSIKWRALKISFVKRR